MTGSSRPSKVGVRAYSVGFGDCFLLTFQYGDAPGPEDRQVLIDCGSTEAPEGAPPRTEMLRRIAADVQQRCQGKLHAVVATHRHADHINGFATSPDGKGSGDLLRDCAPERVLQPWTEDPAAPADPLESPYGSAGDRQAFFASLTTFHALASSAGQAAERMRRTPGYNPALLDQLRVLTANNLGFREPANQSAIANLTRMGEGGRARYLSYGQAADLDLPGVEVSVLGPPTLAQSRDILRQRSSNPDEYWQFYSAQSPAARQRMLEVSASTIAGQTPLFSPRIVPASTASGWEPQNTRWFIRHMNALHTDRLLRLVRTVDGVLNNTSLILLFQVGDQKLLFPGDAQWENWSFCLEHAPEKDANRKLLSGVTLFKVGHHGSRNATPKTLWHLIQSQNLQSVLSTKEGKHGHSDRKTEVPRETLVRELQRFNFFSTQELSWDATAGAEPPSKRIDLFPRYGS